MPLTWHLLGNMRVREQVEGESGRRGLCCSKECLLCLSALRRAQKRALSCKARYLFPPCMPIISMEALDSTLSRTNHIPLFIGGEQ